MQWLGLKGCALATALMTGTPVAGIDQAQGQTQGQTQDQGRPEGCLIEVWPDFLGPGLQTHQVRETLSTDAGQIFAIEFGPLAGEYAKLWMFFLVHEGCERKVFLVGAFNYITELARENGSIGPEATRYHLDLFQPEGHTTLEFRAEPPRYEEMREMALENLR